MNNEQMKELFKQAWKEVFGVEEVNDDDDFFEIGGDSIKGVQIVTWLLQKGIKLEMMKVFTEPTFGELSKYLEETKPMYVPEAIVTKEMAGKTSATSTTPQPAQSQGQLCTPEQIAAAQSQGQLCTPEQMAAAQSQGQLCTPEQIAAAQSQGQLCTPEQIAAAQSQGQLCTPQQMAAAQMGQLCTPEQIAAAQMSQLCTVAQMAQKQLCTPQQMAAAQNQLCFPGMMPAPQQKPDVYEIDKPVENPNVINIQEPHISAPTKSPEEALKTVFSTIFPQNIGADDNLFEKGLDSFKVMQIVTRTAENGYRIKMQDIFKNPTFNGIVSKMEAGK